MVDNLDDVSIAPLPEVVSLEVMLYNGKLEYDFAVLENVVRRFRLKRGRNARKLKEFTMRDVLSDYIF